MSILSKVPDGVGYHYGFAEDDHRQINVRREGSFCLAWFAYVDGKLIDGAWPTKDEAEAAAIKWIKTNPNKENADENHNR